MTLISAKAGAAPLLRPPTELLPFARPWDNLLLSYPGTKTSDLIAKSEISQSKRGSMTFKTIPEATRELRISKSSLYRLLNRGDGPRVVKVGGRTLVPADEMAAWVSKLRNPFENTPDAA